MADNIIKLRIESSEYESKLKRAADGLQRFGEEAHQVGKAIDLADKEQANYIRMIGQMETVNRSARGKINELSNAFVELSSQYRHLTDEEKNSPFGEALSSSIEQLKQRVQDGKKELEDINRELNATSNEGQETGGVMKQLADRFTINVDAMKLFEVGLSAINGALDIVRDAFFKNEEHLDDWGRTVKGCESLYNGFINALNTGDISGYLSNIDDIISAARDAYNALDELSTFNAFNQINNAAGRTDLQNAINDFRSQGGKGDRSRVLAAAAVYKQNLTERQQLERAAYEAEVANYARQRGVNPQDLMNALSGSYGNYKSLKAVPMTGKAFSTVGGGGFGFSQTIETAVPANEMERLGQALRGLNDTELEYLQGLGAAAQQTGYEIAGVDRQLTRVLRPQNTTTPTTPRGGGRGSGGGSAVEALLPIGSMAELNKQMQELRKEQSLVTNASDWQSYQQKIDEVQNKIKGLTGELAAIGVGGLASSNGISFTDNAISQVADAQKALREKALNLKPVESNQKEKPREVNLSKEVGSIVSGISSIGSNLEQMGITLPEGMKDVLGGIQGVIGVLTTISTIVSAIEAISAADTLIPFARGGIVPHAAAGYFVPGYNYSSDTTPVLANAGELILNRAAQNNIASQLQEASRGGSNGIARVSGEQIYIATNAYLRRSGKGELVTWK